MKKPNSLDHQFRADKYEKKFNVGSGIRTRHPLQ